MTPRLSATPSAPLAGYAAPLAGPTAYPLFVTLCLPFVPSHQSIIPLWLPVMPLYPLITPPLTNSHTTLSAACLPERCVVL